MLNNIGKRILFAVLFLCLSYAQPAARAWADVSYTSIWSVSDQYSTNQDTEFTLSEKPWLYFQVPTTSEIINLEYWISPSVFDPFTEAYKNSSLDIEIVKVNEAGGYTEVWAAMSDANWGSKAEVGEWGFYVRSVSGGVYYSGSGSFSVVTPEPLSCVLFVAGGGLLAVLKKKRKTSRHKN